MATLGGVAVRPPGSDRFWPPEGTRVPWKPVVGVQMTHDQARAHGVPVLGVIGNTAHLQKHGDHTPWSVIDGVQKFRGLVYAIDLDMPASFGPWLITKCKSDYPTSFLDFWNFHGKQYDYAGNPVASSGDHHFHMSINRGHENTPVNLVNDYFREMDAMTPSEIEALAKALAPKLLAEQVQVPADMWNLFPKALNVTATTKLPVSRLLFLGPLYAAQANAKLDGIDPEVDIQALAVALAEQLGPELAAELAAGVSDAVESLLARTRVVTTPPSSPPAP